jgi:hypothetical protein
MAYRGGRGPPPLSAGSDPRIKLPARKLSTENKPNSRLSQDAPSALPREASEVFAWHFARYVAGAALQSITDAAETETNPRELLRFADARFHAVIYGFEASFFDSWDAIGAPFREAAKNSIQTGRRA